MRDQAQDQSNSQPSRPAHIYGFGSSSSEVLDYIFGDSPRYHSYWASGWSGRGLRKKDNRDYVLRCLRQAEPQDVILLHFGMVDAVFNAAYRVQKGDFWEPDAFCREVADGLEMLIADLKAAGFTNVHAIAFAAPNPLASNYFRRLSKMFGLPVRYQGALYARMNQYMAERCGLIDLTPQLANSQGVLKPEYRRARANHHADFAKIQGLVWEAIRDLPNMPPRQEVWHEVLYKAPPRIGIAKRLAAGHYRRFDLSIYDPAKNPAPWPLVRKPLARKNRAQAGRAKVKQN